MGVGITITLSVAQKALPSSHRHLPLRAPKSGGKPVQRGERRQSHSLPPRRRQDQSQAHCLQCFFLSLTERLSVGGMRKMEF